GGDGHPPPVDEWEDAVDGFVSATCSCPTTDTDICRLDVSDAMEEARGVLDDDEESACIDCLAAKESQLRRKADARCDDDVVDLGAIHAACDLDPATDYDRDGVPDNDDDEACGGYP
ncbi:MAG TPA: hypothetical protein VFU21_18565, partial [Kofleriaceae bacterium]|nr:hypothetical protein [Kofleriaceae bacterium]